MDAQRLRRRGDVVLPEVFEQLGRLHAPDYAPADSSVKRPGMATDEQAFLR
jgi:hypothetical protein